MRTTQHCRNTLLQEKTTAKTFITTTTTTAIAMTSNSPLLDAGSSSWLIGVALCSISSFGTGLAKLAIRKSWLLEEEHAAKKEALPSSVLSPSTNDGSTCPSATRLRYAAFLFISLVNPALDITALAFASPSILAPFSGVSLAWVVLLSKRMVGEAPRRQQILGALLIMVGEVVVALFGDHSPHNGNNGADRAQPQHSSGTVEELVGLVVDSFWYTCFIFLPSAPRIYSFL